jgi:hypothetical protein
MPRLGRGSESTQWASVVRATRRRAGAALRRMPGLRDRFEQRPDPTEPWVATVAAELAAGDPDRAHRLAEQAWRRRPDHIQLQDLLIASLDHRGMCERALALSIQNATRRLGWLARRRLAGRRPRRLGPAQRIFAAGFFRSGSSAVLDYLRGIDGATGWTPAGEMRLLKAPGGIAELVNRHHQQGSLTDRDLVDFYLHLTGWKLTRHPPGSFHPRALVNRHSATLFRNRRAFGYLHTCLQAFLELVDLTATANPTTADLEGLFRDLLARALDVAATDTGAELLLIDQAVNAWRLPLSRFLPPSTFVIVHRDPRDQYVDVRQIRQQPGHPATTAESFTREYRRNRTRADRDIPLISQRYGHHCVRLSFEDFVLDHQRQTRELTDTLGLPPPRTQWGHYVPTRGRDGIGRHLALASPTEIATLTASLPEYLDDRVTGSHQPA